MTDIIGSVVKMEFNISMRQKRNIRRKMTDIYLTVINVANGPALMS